MREHALNLLCQICATSFRCSLHVLAIFYKLLKNKNIVKKVKKCLKTSDLVYTTPSWRGGRVVEGAPLLRGLKPTSKSLFSLIKSIYRNLAVPELSQFALFSRHVFLCF